MRALQGWPLLLLLAGCGAATDASPTATPPPIAAVATAMPAPTATPSPPPTATPAPTATSSPSPTATPAPVVAPATGYPIGLPGRAPGDGFFIRHGYAVENSWFNPNHWHTGEDWYALEGDTAGAAVLAIAAGEVVYVGANYPGRVVIVRHAADLYSMYGHLDPVVAVQTGQAVERGALLGTVLRRSDQVPNHLHIEVRTFLTAREVNGAAPRYGFRCGVNCPPGPGYWPIAAPDHPGALGWRNPTHVIAQRAFAPEPGGALGAVVAVTPPISPVLTLWSAPPGAASARVVGEAPISGGERFTLLAIQAGAEDQRTTGAAAYQLWYQIELEEGQRGWVQATVATDFETGGDGRPATVRLTLVPAATDGVGAAPPDPSGGP